MCRVTATVWSGLAAALVWGALVVPTSLSAMSPGAFVRIPLTGLLALGVLLVVPTRARRAVALVLGVALAVVVVVKALDVGFFVVVDRRFHEYDDWANLGRGVVVLSDWIGRGWTVLVLVASALVAVVVLGGVIRAVLRVARVAPTHRKASVRVLAAGALVWLLCSVTGVQAGGGPVASTGTARLVWTHAAGAWADHRDEGVFADAIASDPWADRSDLLTGLDGKDVLVVFVESYGRAAASDPRIAKGVTPVLAAGEESLGEKGFGVRSGWLTSPTFGAGSWLAHATLQSGLWVDSDRRYGQLLEADRMMLTSAFGDAGWRTGFVLPAVEEAWPEGRSFYGFDRLHGTQDLDYRGPSLGWGGVPDQYTLSWFRREVLAEEGAPVMAEIDLVSSHNPWPQPPPLVPWEEVGDGSVYACMPGCAGGGADDVRSRYAASIGYSLQSVISFVEAHPDPDLVVLLVGDHQPWSYVSGENASHDVPVSLIAGDPAVLDQVSGWDWAPGLVPAKDSPVWRMDAFRDRFLRTFSGDDGWSPGVAPTPVPEG